MTLFILSPEGVDIGFRDVVFFHLSGNGFEMPISVACSLDYAQR